MSNLFKAYCKLLLRGQECGIKLKKGSQPTLFNFSSDNTVELCSRSETEEGQLVSNNGQENMSLNDHLLEIIEIEIIPLGRKHFMTYIWHLNLQIKSLTERSTLLNNVSATTQSSKDLKIQLKPGPSEG